MQPVREVYSLLMPVSGGRVILPRAAIAEVTGYIRPKDRPEDAPAFVLGFIDWQDQRIPLVSFEAACGQPVPELGRRTRIAVVFGIAGRLNPNVFAVVTQGYPYLVRVNENVLQHEPIETDEPLVLARVRMANEKPYIPDLEKLEVMIAEGLGAAANDAVSSEPVDELDAIDVGEDDEDADALLVEPSDDDDTPAPDAGKGVDGEATIHPGDVNLDEVTAFGTETNYSVELDALSSALEGDGENAESDDDLAIDLSGLDVDADKDGDSGNPDNDADIDFSDIEIDFDDDEKKPD